VFDHVLDNKSALWNISNMERVVTRRQVLSSLLWKLMERGGTQGIAFVVSIVLARLLTVEEYGSVAIIGIFIALANVFVQTGFNTALIQKKNVDNRDFSTIFYVSLVIAVLLYALLYFASPLIADFFRQPILDPALRVLSIVLFFGAINSVQVAVVSRQMLFKRLFFSTIGGTIVSGIVGISMAYLGFGVWALVAQQISNHLTVTIIMWFTISWRPQFVFSLVKLKSLFSYGWKILVASLIDTLYLDLRSILIGRFYSPEMVGFYNRGKQFPTLIVNNIDGAIQSVMLPTYSSYQDDLKRVKSIVRRSVVTSSFVIFPIMTLLVFVAEPVVELVLTKKWLPSVRIMQIYCAVYAIRPILTANIQAIKGLGYSGLFLRRQIVDKTVGISIMLTSILFGIEVIAWGVLVSSLVSVLVYVSPSKRILDYSLSNQLKDMSPAFILSLISGTLVYSTGLLPFSLGAKLFLQIIVGILSYALLSRLFRIESFTYLMGLAREGKNHARKRR